MPCHRAPPESSEIRKFRILSPPNCDHVAIMAIRHSGARQCAAHTTATGVNDSCDNKKNNNETTKSGTTAPSPI